MKARLYAVLLSLLTGGALAYQGGTLTPHNHTSTSGQGGSLSNLTVSSGLTLSSGNLTVTSGNDTLTNGVYISSGASGNETRWYAAGTNANHRNWSGKGQVDVNGDFCFLHSSNAAGNPTSGTRSLCLQGVSGNMLFEDSGKFGIGTTSPGTKVHISSGIQTIDGTGSGLDLRNAGTFFGNAAYSSVYLTTISSGTDSAWAGCNVQSSTITITLKQAARIMVAFTGAVGNSSASGFCGLLATIDNVPIHGGATTVANTHCQSTFTTLTAGGDCSFIAPVSGVVAAGSHTLCLGYWSNGTGTCEVDYNDGSIPTAPSFSVFEVNTGGL